MGQCGYARPDPSFSFPRPAERFFQVLGEGLLDQAVFAVDVSDHDARVDPLCCDCCGVATGST